MTNPNGQHVSISTARRRRLFWTVLVLLLGLAMPGSQVARADGWVIECVDCPRFFDHLADRSLQVDAAGHPRVVYGGDHLYYAWHDGSQWQIQVVDPAPDAGHYARLALDASGRAHITYYDATETVLRYAYQEAGPGTWHVEVVGDVVGWTYASLAVGASGQPHIAYEGDHSLMYGYRDGTGWHMEVVDSDSSAGFGYSSLALDRFGRPRVAYFLSDDVDSNWDIRFAFRDQMGWHVQLVDELPGSEGGDTSLALDPNDKPHISYVGEGYEGYDVKYAVNPGSGWQLQTVDEYVDEEGGRTSLALDDAGRPRISYYDYYWHSLSYADRDSGSWEIETVDGAVRDVYTSLALDGNGVAHVVYFHTNGYLLRHAVQGAGEWQIETVDQARAVGSDSSLKVDEQRVPHVSYFDSPQNELWYAVKAPARGAASSWTTEVVAGTGDGGLYTSLALDAAGGPHLAYSYRVPFSTAKQLVYAYRDADGWHAEDVYSITILGSLSIDLGPDAQPRIGYGDGMVAYTWRTQSGWEREYASGATAEDVSLAVTADGWPRLAFCDIWNDSLWFAYKDETGWNSETVAGGVGDCGGHPSLALDSSGNPHISYRIGYPYEYGVKYAYKDGAVWHVETVDSGNWSSSASIAVGADGVPRIAYSSFDGTRYGDLKYATRAAGSWLVSTVPTGRSVDFTVSLALDAEDQPHISYFDGTTFDLKYAYYAVMDHHVYLPVAVNRKVSN